MTKTLYKQIISIFDTLFLYDRKWVSITQCYTYDSTELIATAVFTFYTLVFFLPHIMVQHGKSYTV